MFKFFSHPKVSQGLTVIAQGTLIYYIDKNRRNKALIEQSLLTNINLNSLDKAGQIAAKATTNFIRKL